MPTTAPAKVPSNFNLDSLPLSYARLPPINHVLTNQRVTVPLWRGEQSLRQRKDCVFLLLTLLQTWTTAHDSTTLRRIIKPSNTSKRASTSLANAQAELNPQCHKCQFFDNHEEGELRECDFGKRKATKICAHAQQLYCTECLPPFQELSDAVVFCCTVFCNTVFWTVARRACPGCIIKAKIESESVTT